MTGAASFLHPHCPANPGQAGCSIRSRWTTAIVLIDSRPARRTHHGVPFAYKISAPRIERRLDAGTVRVIALDLPAAAFLLDLPNVITHRLRLVGDLLK